MNFRTDLALECKEAAPDLGEGVKVENFSQEDVDITRIQIVNEEGEKQLNKPIGNYITIETPSFSGESIINQKHADVIKDEILRLIGNEGSVLICGIGNTEITPDALGPKVASLVLATRHIPKEMAQELGLGDLRSVSAVSPGVLGQTGIETGEVLSAIIKDTKPAAVIAVDALASRRLARLGRTVQISDTGITPGSGVGNARNEISKNVLGVPVISIGVPTVVDASTLARDISGLDDEFKEARDMMVTPKEVDLLIDRAARLIAHSINCALQPHITPEDLLMLVG